MAEVVERQVATIALSVLESGFGGRPLLLTHGFTGAKEDFGDWMDRFAEAGFWAVAPDLRGHGSSDQPEGEDHYSLSAYADDLLGLADQLGWERFSLLGHSMGGMVALEPDTVAMGVEVIRTQGLAALLELMATLPQPPRAPSDASLRATRPGYAEFADAKVHRCSEDMYAAMAWVLATRVDRLAELRTLQVPTLVVVGAEDRGFVEPSRRMAAAIDGAELAVIADAAHSPQFENPEAWWDAVSTFLAGASR
jgi:pimeloyl-ACP methyl ester carboxylesterase